MDYQINVKIQNGRIRKAMRDKGIFTVADLWREMGGRGRYPSIAKLVNMQMSPKLKNGQWRPIVDQMAAALATPPEMLFSEKQMGGFSKNKFEVSVSEDEMEQIASSEDMQAQIENKVFTEEILENLESRYSRGAQFLRMNYGINRPAMTCEEIGREMNISKARVNVIILKALKMARSFKNKEGVLIDHA